MHHFSSKVASSSAFFPYLLIFMSSAFRNFKSVDAAVTRVVVKISCCASVSNEHASVQIRRQFLCNQEIDRYLSRGWSIIIRTVIFFKISTSLFCLKMSEFYLQIWYALGFGYRQLAQKIWWHYLKNCRFFYIV